MPTMLMRLTPGANSAAGIKLETSNLYFTSSPFDGLVLSINPIAETMLPALA